MGIWIIDNYKNVYYMKKARNPNVHNKYLLSTVSTCIYPEQNIRYNI